MKNLMALGLCALSCGLTGCLSMGTSTTSFSAAAGASGALPGSSSSGSQGSQVAIAAISQQQMNLGTSLTVPVMIQSQNGYSGPVNLSIDNKVLAANDPMNTISVSVAPSSVNLVAGGSAQASVSITSQASSPDLSSFLNVVASTAGGQVVAQVPLVVNPVFEVDILSSGNLDTTGIEDWSLAAGSTTKFTTHAKGVTIKFVNKDPVEMSGFYRIHSSATAFLHQGGEGLGVPGSQTPDVQDGKNASTLGPVYTVLVTSQASQLSDTFYDHNNESSGKAARIMEFNAYAAPPVIGNSGNPNASFAYISKNMINNSSMCMSCHVSDPSMGGGISFANYADVMPYVQAGSPLGSAFYISIAPGGSMPLNNPGSVSPALVQDVHDWISDGALNN